LDNKNYVAFGNKLYFAKGNQGYDVYAIEDGVAVFESNFSYSGTALNKLNSPTAGTAFQDEIVITDTEADRLIFVGENTVSLAIDHPTCITSSDHRIYVKTTDGIAIVEDKEVKSIISTDLEIVDMLCTDRLYVLAQDGVYTLLSGRLIKVFDVEGGIAFVFDNLFYVLTFDSVEAYDMDGNVNSLLSVDLEGVNRDLPLDLLTNSRGDVFVLFDNSIVLRFDWWLTMQINTGKLDHHICAVTTVDSNEYQYTAKSMFLKGDRLMFVTNENAVVSVTSPIYGQSRAERPDLSNLSPEFYATSKYSYFMGDKFVGSTARFVEENTTVLAYKIGNELYGMVDGEEGWFYNVDQQFSPDTSVAYTYRIVGDAKLYFNPEYDSYITPYEGCKNLNVVDDAAGYDNGSWYRVKYDGQLYFVKRDVLEKISPIGPVTPPPQQEEEVKADYGRAKASRAGEYVPLYSSIGGDVAISVKDGTRLEIIEKVGDYYKVKWDDGEYFVRQDQFKLDGLTTVQIVAIVLSIVVVMAGGLIFAVTSLTRKKEENR
jgi:hypothetical protein